MQAKGAATLISFVQHFSGHCHSTDAGKNYVQQLTSTALAPYLETGMTEVEKRQRAVDSPEEYFRLDQFQARCSGV